MPYIGIGIGIVIIIIVIYLKLKQMDQTQQKALIDMMSLYGDFDAEKMMLSIQQETYKVILFKVPHRGELTINSPKIWEINGSRGQKLIHMDQYLSGTEKKIVVIYPDVTPIKRYINENEMVFIKHSFFLNMYVIRAHELEDFLKQMRDTDGI